MSAPSARTTNAAGREARREGSVYRLGKLARHPRHRLPRRRFVAVRQGGHHPPGEFLDVRSPRQEMGHPGVPIHRPREARGLGRGRLRAAVFIGDELNLGQRSESRSPLSLNTRRGAGLVPPSRRAADPPPQRTAPPLRFHRCATDRSASSHGSRTTSMAPMHGS